MKKNNVESVELNNLYTPTPLLCYDCNRQTKSKLEDENKKTFFMYVLHVYMMKNTQTRKQKA